MTLTCRFHNFVNPNSINNCRPARIIHTTCLEEVWTELDCRAQRTARNSGQHSYTKLPPADSQTHILSPKFKERVLGICGLYDKFCNSTAFAPCRSQWPRGLRRRSTAARLLRLWVRIPQGALMSVCCECCVLSGRGLCDGLITRPEESYRLWRVVVCDQETSKTRRLKPATGLYKYNHNGL